MNDDEDFGADADRADDLGDRLAAAGRAIGPLLLPNARKALARLTGATVDLCEAALSARTVETRLRSARNVLVTAQELSEQTRVPRSVLLDVVAKQARLDDVVVSAIEHIAKSAEDDQRPGDRARADAEPGKTTDDDWFDVFRSEAADRCRGEVREAFVRILASEIQCPGTFSVRTLRVLGSISTETASRFRMAASMCIMKFGPDDVHPIDARIPDLAGEIWKRAPAIVGLGHEALADLSENGLLRGEFSFSTHSWSAFHASKYPYPDRPFLHQGKWWLLVPIDPEKTRGQTSVAGAVVTRSGIELLEVVDIEPKHVFTDNVRAYFEGRGYRMVEVASRHSRYRDPSDITGRT